MKKEFKKEFERAEGRTEQWCAVKRLEVSFEEFIKKLKEELRESKPYPNTQYVMDLYKLFKIEIETKIDKLSGELK